MSKGAPKGNQFWKLRAKHGRDKLFKTPELFWDACAEYFQWCDDNPFYKAEQSRAGKSKKEPSIGSEGITEVDTGLIDIPVMRPYTIQGLCIYLDTNAHYFKEFEDGLKGKEDKLSKDFSVIVKRVREIIYNQKFSGAASGFFNPSIIARDLGLSEKSEITGKDGQALPILNIQFKTEDDQNLSEK